MKSIFYAVRPFSKMGLRVFKTLSLAYVIKNIMNIGIVTNQVRVLKVRYLKIIIISNSRCRSKILFQQSSFLNPLLKPIRKTQPATISLHYNV